MLSALSGSVAFAPTAGVRAPTVTTASVRMETKADLEVLAKKLNPVVGFYDPLGLADAVIDGDNEAAIGWLRHAEIKHGRVAMAAFVGYIVQSNGINFPWSTTLSGMTYSDIAAAGSPPAQWDAVPTNAKWQIFFLIAGLELWSECAMDKHYMKGGKPGDFPSFEPIRKEIGHPTLDLFDPFGLSKNRTPEQKEKGLLAEINNGARRPSPRSAPPPAPPPARPPPARPHPPRPHPPRLPSSTVVGGGHRGLRRIRMDAGHATCWLHRPPEAGGVDGGSRGVCGVGPEGSLAAVVAFAA